MDLYYARPEVSNSDLGVLNGLLYSRIPTDPTEAYRFGNLLDGMVTEPEKIDYFKRSCEGDVFKPKVFDQAVKMKQAFWDDKQCADLMKISEFQKVMSANLKIDFRGFEFEIAARCKWDGWIERERWGWDLKSTVATTQRGFEQSVEFFNYLRQRAYYMDIAKTDRDLLIGVSKKNFKVFKAVILRGDVNYQKGFDQYSSLAFKHHLIYREAC